MLLLYLTNAPFAWDSQGRDAKHPRGSLGMNKTRELSGCQEVLEYRETRYIETICSFSLPLHYQSVDPQITVRGEVKVTEHFMAISSWPLGLAGLHIPWLSFSNFLYLGLMLLAQKLLALQPACNRI